VVLANKDLFIEKQGNFGNVLTGDEASAARYIECKVTPFAKHVLYNPELTDFEDSYDGRNREPLVFPAKIPVVLIQGAEGIAVGMSTKILPHNLIEVLEAVQGALRGEIPDLYPDFLSGGLIDVSAYDGGQGKVLVRAKLDTSDPKRIVIRELPYGTTTESIMASVENAARRGKVKIAGINDFTTENIEIEVKLPRGVYTEDVVDALYAFTDCEMSISTSLLVIKDGNPHSMRVSEVIAHHARKLEEILKAELELEQRHLRDRLHARTLERIFVEERIYKDIEEMKTQESVVAAVIEGFKPFAKQIKRRVTEEDVERLLKIPIRRISRYDIEKARKEVEEIKSRLAQIKEHLSDIKSYAHGYLQDIIDSRKTDFPRKTTIRSFDRTDVREAAQRNLTLRYDSGTGYLGYEVGSGKALFDVSPYDRVLVMRASGDYSVINVPDKVFVGKGMLSCGLADKEVLAKKVFTIIYRNEENKFPYIKRTKIEQFILDKNYSIVPPKSKILKVTTRDNVSVHLTYKPKPRMQVTEESFPLKDYLVKGVRASGTRLAAKEVKSVKFV
jgi:topoisomerase-4 subunit A